MFSNGWHNEWQRYIQTDTQTMQLLIQKINPGSSYTVKKNGQTPYDVYLRIVKESESKANILWIFFSYFWLCLFNKICFRSDMQAVGFIFFCFYVCRFFSVHKFYGALQVYRCLKARKLNKKQNKQNKNKKINYSQLLN